MNLTEREHVILQLETKGLSDYRIARKINIDPPSITRSKKNAHKKDKIKSLFDFDVNKSLGNKEDVIKKDIDGC